MNRIGETGKTEHGTKTCRRNSVFGEGNYWGISSAPESHVPDFSIINTQSINQEVVNALRASRQMARGNEGLSERDVAHDDERHRDTVRVLDRAGRFISELPEPTESHPETDEGTGIRAQWFGDDKSDKEWIYPPILEMVWEQGLIEMEIEPPSQSERGRGIPHGFGDRTHTLNLGSDDGRAQIVVHSGRGQWTEGCGHATPDDGQREAIARFWEVANPRQRAEWWKVRIAQAEQGFGAGHIGLFGSAGSTDGRYERSVLDREEAKETSETPCRGRHKKASHRTFGRFRNILSRARLTKDVREQTIPSGRADRDDIASDATRESGNDLQNLYRRAGPRDGRSITNYPKIVSCRTHPVGRRPVLILSVSKTTGISLRDKNLVDLADDGREWVPFIDFSDSFRTVRD